MTPIKYETRNFDTVPTYTDKEFLKAIHDATGLSRRKDIAFAIDLMAGPGKVAFGMQEISPEHTYAVLDNNQKQLDNITQPIRKILGDVRNLVATIENRSVDVVTMRYGLKDIPKDQQQGVLTGVNEILKTGGIFVLTDMISPEGMQEWLNMQHSKKQQLSGRIIKEEGECNIPTEKGWLEMLKKASFEAEVFGYYTSRVSTVQWLTGSQFGDPKSPGAAKQKAIMDEIILGASDVVKKQFNIREENGEIKIDYPVVIIKAIKKEVEPTLSDSGEIYAS